MELDLSRGLNASGEDSREALGEGLFLFNEFALSAIDGDFVSRMLPARTAKKAGDGRGAAPGVKGAVGARLDNFSRAFIRCEIPEPTLTFFAIV